MDNAVCTLKKISWGGQEEKEREKDAMSACGL